MASPPVISAPTLVTSTNQVATATPTSAAGMTCIATPPTSPPKNDNDNWHFKYMEAKGNYRKLKAQMRDQAKKSRQLIVAVKNKLQEEENEKIKMRSHFEQELSGLCQQLLSLQAAMLREQSRVKSVIEEKDRIILQQKQEIDKLQNQSTAVVSPQTNPNSVPSSTISNVVPNSTPNVVPNGILNGTMVVPPNNSVSVTSLSGLSPVALGGSLRIHGSFRQYKKDREKIRQQLKSGTSTTSVVGTTNNNNPSQQGDPENSTLADSSSSSSGININSSEESSSSPSTLPRTQKGVLRQTLSSGAVEDQTSTIITNSNKLNNQKKKGILKASSSVDSSPVKDILTNLDQLISDKLPVSKSSSTKININREDKSDSGRESDDMVPNTVPNGTSGVPNVSVVTVSTTDSCSANSSFDGSDPTLGWKINVKNGLTGVPNPNGTMGVPNGTIAPQNSTKPELNSNSHPTKAIKPDIDPQQKKIKPEVAPKEMVKQSLNELVDEMVPTSVPNGSKGKPSGTLGAPNGTIGVPKTNNKQPSSSVSTLNKKVKPPPPPRSSQTRLSTIKPKSILSPKQSLNTEISPTEALDNLIRNVDTNKLRQSEKKKRVKFNPRIDTSSTVTGLEVDHLSKNNENNSVSKPLDPNFLHFLPRLANQKQEMVKKSPTANQNQEIMTNDNVNNKNFSYYEPYI